MINFYLDNVFLITVTIISLAIFIPPLGMFILKTIWQIIYTVGGKQLAGWLDKGGRLAWLNRGCGVIFILIAAALLADVMNSFMV